MCNHGVASAGTQDASTHAQACLQASKAWSSRIMRVRATQEAGNLNAAKVDLARARGCCRPSRCKPPVSTKAGQLCIALGMHCAMLTQNTPLYPLLPSCRFLSLSPCLPVPLYLAVGSCRLSPFLPLPGKPNAWDSIFSDQACCRKTLSTELPDGGQHRDP